MEPFINTQNGELEPALACHDRAVTDPGEADVNRAPVCPQCGVTALAADIATVLDSRFICENPDCDGGSATTSIVDSR